MVVGNEADGISFCLRFSALDFPKDLASGGTSLRAKHRQMFAPFLGRIILQSL